MKKAILIFLLIIGAVVARAQDSEGPKLPPDLDMLKYFYSTYMASFNDSDDPRLITRKQTFLRRGFFTERALKRYQQLFEEKGMDPLVKAQDTNMEMIRTLQVAKDAKEANKYIVTFEMPEKTTVELNLLKEKNEWKIDYLY